ncbi:MAG: Inosine-uridine preferring nucleoside hydrolase [uncultured Rubrobacteraceae bacterium]|uniref:Inosine-uridine preferring nucleoside hydrolase n=1 Tax=uncultured Rubrobacteraceae bacterium TaxID=349277 RepID=A0A6J4ST39_9ACTN|nr:MAG: Inosine-uridine preferring nucleoside hydrolase [uncultured Rubrobacteraceae bacterium]
MRRLLIDTDTGSDDAVALVMALKHPGVTVEAVTVVAGNVPLEQGVQNALYTLELCGADVPVFRGAGTPLLCPPVGAEEVHGLDGMGDIGLPLSGRDSAPGHAVDVLVERIGASPGELTLVTLGPLTNVALALLRDPSIADKVEGCVMMGGTGRGPGNVTPVAEYNVWADPEAAKVVFESGLPLKMVGWDVSREYAVFGPEDAARLRDIGTPLAEFCVDIQRVLDAWAKENTHLAGFDLPDPMAMAVALDPSVATGTRRLFVAVETGGTWRRGQTVVDRLGVTGYEPNAEVVMAASRKRFLDLLHASVER